MPVHHRCKPEAQARAALKTGPDAAPVWTYPQAQVLEALAQTDLVLFDGGNGGGKSYLLALIVSACLKGLPWARPFCGDKPWIAVIGVTFPQIRDTIFRYLHQFIPKWMRHKEGRETEGVPEFIDLCNGARLIFLTASQDVDAHAGRRLDLAVYDEHPVEAHLHEGFFRMNLEPGRTFRILIGMTPVKGKSWIYEQIVRRKDEIGAKVITSSLFENGVAPCQTCQHDRAWWDAELKHRGWSRRTAEAEAACPRCATYGVEPRATQAFFEKTRTRFKDFPKELRARLYGTWEDLDGERCLTEAEATVLATALEEPREQRGGTAIFRAPSRKRMYCAGIDTSKGNEGDETVNQMLDLDGGQVAIWADRRTPANLYTEEFIELGREYGRAKACVESMDVGYFVIQGLLAAGIPCYQERNPLKAHGWNKTGPRASVFGLHPTPRNRDRILVQMIEDCRKSIRWSCPCHAETACPEGRESSVGTIVPGQGLVIRDRKTWEQVTKLRRNPERQGRIDVTSGEDDRALALALANECRRSLGGWMEPGPEPEPLPPGVRLSSVLPPPGQAPTGDALGPLSETPYLQSLADEV